jgi:hypothetical protein
MTINPLLLVSMATGVCFFAWPLRMNQSGLSTASVMLMYASVAIVVSLVAMAVAPGAWAELRGKALWLGVQGGVLNVLGIVAYAYMLAHVTSIEAPRYILIAITIQTALTGAWAAYQTGGFEPRLVLGLATAFATLFLLRGKG